MLPKSTIAEVDRLLQVGKLSQRKIAERLQVGRGTVSAIARGQRGLHGREPDDERGESLAPCLPTYRCPRCGYRVFRPCQICRARDHQRRRAARFIRVA